MGKHKFSRERPKPWRVVLIDNKGDTVLLNETIRLLTEHLRSWSWSPELPGAEIVYVDQAHRIAWYQRT